MKLKEQAIQKINGRVRLQLAFKLGFTEQWIIKCLKENKNNGPLTLTSALEVILEETGLSKSEVLDRAAIPQDR